VLGTAGWIRTTDLLIHSLRQVVDFPRVCGKRLLKIQRFQGDTDVRLWHPIIRSLNDGADGRLSVVNETG
jgi:hypothetical protein